MKRTFAVLAALLMAALTTWPAETMAQLQQPSAPPPVPMAPEPEKQTPGTPMPQKEQEVRGSIKSVDPSGKEITLEDGTKLVIPGKVKVKREALKEGAMVNARYKEEGGLKVVTRIDVQPQKKL